MEKLTVENCEGDGNGRGRCGHVDVKVEERLGEDGGSNEIG